MSRDIVMYEIKIIFNPEGLVIITNKINIDSVFFVMIHGRYCSEHYNGIFVILETIQNYNRNISLHIYLEMLEYFSFHIVYVSDKSSHILNHQINK